MAKRWEYVTPFLAFPAEVRRVIYTTNAIEALNRQLRKAIETKGHFPNEDAASPPESSSTSRSQTRSRNGPAPSASTALAGPERDVERTGGPARVVPLRLDLRTAARPDRGRPHPQQERPMQITRNSLDTASGHGDSFTGTVYIDTIAAPELPAGAGAAQRSLHPGFPHPLAHPSVRADDLRHRGRRSLPARGRARHGDPPR